MIMLLHIKRVFLQCAQLRKNYDYQDVALLETDRTIIFAWNIQPILIHPYLIPNGTKLMLYGHGLREDNERSAVLQEVETYYLDEDACQGYIKKETPFDLGVLCHSPFKTGKGTCFGDSGSPVVMQVQ
ncbi:trypsin-4-like [Drosophila busckii]|uniref:trypsin-4-like n=1 Tax=Drosophila busckii TaxID=30019 RepID=UPI00083F4521|nr:trypsin-4-like [Drosophila busckii]